MPIPFDNYSFDFPPRQTVLLENGKTTRVDIEIALKDVYYGRVAFNDGKPAIPDFDDAGRTTQVLLWSGPTGLGKGELDRDGNFKVCLGAQEIEAIARGDSRLSISYPDPDRLNASRSIGDFPYEMLAKSRDAVTTLTVERPSFDDPEPVAERSTEPQLDGPIELELMSVTGKNVSLEQFRGKVVLLNIFATWCGPCNSEIPNLIQLHNERAGDDFVIVSVSRKEEAETVEPFVRKKDIPYTVLLDPDGKGTYQFTHGEGKMSIPTNYLLDRDLNPVYVGVGYNEELFKRLTDELDSLLSN